MSESETECTIVFDNSPEKVFYGGQLLRGRVELTFVESVTVKGKTKTIFGIE